MINAETLLENQIQNVCYFERVWLIWSTNVAASSIIRAKWSHSSKKWLNKSSAKKASNIYQHNSKELKSVHTFHLTLLTKMHIFKIKICQHTVYFLWYIITNCTINNIHFQCKIDQSPIIIFTSSCISKCITREN